MRNSENVRQKKSSYKTTDLKKIRLQKFEDNGSLKLRLWDGKIQAIWFWASRKKSFFTAGFFLLFFAAALGSVVANVGVDDDVAMVVSCDGVDCNRLEFTKPPFS